jgi:hypothetical protein
MVPLLNRIDALARRPVIPMTFRLRVPQKMGQFPSPAAHELMIYGFRELLMQGRSTTFNSTQTESAGSPGSQDCGISRIHSVPVVPHAGQMHNYHIVMASLNSPMAGSPPVALRWGNELSASSMENLHPSAAISI